MKNLTDQYWSETYAVLKLENADMIYEIAENRIGNTHKQILQYDTRKTFKYYYLIWKEPQEKLTSDSRNIFRLKSKFERWLMILLKLISTCNFVLLYKYSTYVSFYKI